MKQNKISYSLHERYLSGTNTFLRLMLLCLLLFPGGNKSIASLQHYSVRMHNVSFREVAKEIEKQTGYTFLFGDHMINKLRTIHVDYTGNDLKALLSDCLKETGLTYKIVENTIVLMPQHPVIQAKKQSTEIKGIVMDSHGGVLPGVTVLIKDSSIGVVTDMDGKFAITLPKLEGITLVFSFVGMNKKEVKITNSNPLKVILAESKNEMDEVVVTGIYTRNKESFTGSSQTYKGSDLKMAGNQNLLQSLKTLDPSFAILENNQFGSDPNRLPDIEIRGKTSIVGLKEQFGEDPNQPLFILDGFETDLQTVMDLSMDRIGAVTILKDAASTAIYGAKAANGVVVVETKAPEKGKIRLSYSGNFDISFADLTDYNLMNAEEKLQFELLSGRFESNLPAVEEDNIARYNRLLGNVRRGVDTYWMSEPLRTAFNQRHNLFVQGGDEQMRYGLGINYTDIQGVMLESGRKVMSGNLDLLYRKGKVSFSNKLTVDYTKTTDPLVPFSEYSRTNPYYPKYNEDEGINKWLETPMEDTGVGVQNEQIWVPNPMWNDRLSSYKKGNTFGVRNNFNMEYRPWDFLYIRGRFGINKATSNDESFTSPDNTDYDRSELLNKGFYSDNRGESFSYDGDFTVTYGKLVNGKHQINAVMGMAMNEFSNTSKAFSASGFPEGDFATPGFANKYPDNSKPSYSDYKKRNANFYFNGGYSYLNRYLLDLNLRADGSSVFGSNKQFTTTWAVGMAWNLHNESFFRGTSDFFSMLKLRASIGNPGNQNFGSFNAITTYKFNNWLLNNFGTGLLVDAFGDPDLEWQKTLDKNIGCDISTANNRFHINFDYYHKSTDPLLASVGIPLSVGVSSRLTNIGKQVDTGFSGTIKYSIVYRPEERKNWTTSLMFRHGKAHYDKIGDKLNTFNKNNLAKNLTRYYDGGSPTALWAVRSEGIDPATGKEIFLTESGLRTFSHDYDNEVIVGDTRPKLEGVFGNTLYWKGFSCNVYIRYSYGADAFNSTLYEKVENISASDLNRNQDKRALYDRWQKPGDKAKYKGISLTDKTPISSRFVQKNNYITLESIRLGYEFDYKLMQKLKLSGMTLSAYMNEIYRFSTIKDERGIDYPFARSFSFALSINF